MRGIDHGFYTLCATEIPNSFGEIYSHNLPIFQTSTFIYPSVEKATAIFEGNDEGYIYSRWENPTVRLLEKKIASLEAHGLHLAEAEALLFNSGMAAIKSIIETLSTGRDFNLLAPGGIYGTSTDLFNTLSENDRFQITYADFTDQWEIEELISRKSIHAIYLESPTNPLMEVFDMEAISKLAERFGIPTILDNTFCSPVLQQPLRWGITIVIYSGTKFLNGHGSGLSGVAVSADRGFMKKLWNHRKISGSIISPMEAYLLHQGIKTLPVRMERQCTTALKLALWLKDCTGVEEVFYPGFRDKALVEKQMSLQGALLSVKLKGGYEACIRLMKQLKTSRLTASLGTTDTLIQHPASMTHVKVPKELRERFGITDSLLRVSVGLEALEDIQVDFSSLA